MRFRVHARLGLFGFALVVVGACSATSRADVERAEALAQDPIFERTAEMWSPTTDIVVQPGMPAPASGASVIYQHFDLGAVDDPTAEMLALSVILEESGWFDLGANCDYLDEQSILSLSGRKEDDIGYVTARLMLFVPSPSADWIARVEITATLVTDPLTEVSPRDRDLSCLSQ